MPYVQVSRLVNSILKLILIAVHFQQNLEAGFATRAIRCDGASDWDIRGNRLIWSKGDEEVSICDLRTADNKSILESELLSLDTSHSLPEVTGRPYVRILPGGDFLITTLTTFVIKDTIKETHQLRRISAQGYILWSVELDAFMTRPAVGEDSVYFRRGPWYRDDSRTCKMSFAKYRLSDGSKIFDETMPPETQENRKIPSLDRSLVLSGNECLASWRRKTPGRGYVEIFSTSSGQLLKTMYQPRSRNGPLLNSVLPSFHTAGVWTTTSRTVKLTTYDEVPGSFLEAEYLYVDGDFLPDPSSMAFDGNHSVFLHTVHAPVGWAPRDNSRANPFAQFAISQVTPTSNDGLESPEGTAVTLPGRSKADGKRRDFELELPWELEDDEGDFFGMMNDYLIYQSPKNGVLVLVDFWPTW